MANPSPAEPAHDTGLGCPICGNLALPYGRQAYAVGEGSVPSLIYRCRACDFNFRRFDRPLQEVFSHFTAAPYSIDAEAQRRRREGFYRYLLGLLSKPAKGKRLLDIGCAFGHFLDCAAAEGYTPFGTEVSEEMADLSRRRRAYPVSTRLLDDLRLPETTFDVITFVDTFYYFEDPMRVLEQCRALLAPGGELLMRVVNRNHLARLHRLMLRARLNREVLPEMPFSATDDAISCHSQRSLLTLMRRTGYRVKMLTGIERGKKDKSLALRAFYGLTQALAWVTAERLAWTPGLICLATAG